MCRFKAIIGVRRKVFQKDARPIRIRLSFEANSLLCYRIIPRTPFNGTYVRLVFAREKILLLPSPIGVHGAIYVVTPAMSLLVLPPGCSHATNRLRETMDRTVIGVLDLDKANFRIPHLPFGRGTGCCRTWAAYTETCPSTDSTGLRFQALFFLALVRLLRNLEALQSQLPPAAPVNQNKRPRRSRAVGKYDAWIVFDRPGYRGFGSRAKAVFTRRDSPQSLPAL